MAASLKCLLWYAAERYASAARAVVLLIVGAGPRRAVRRLVTILRREAAAGVSAALLHFADACRAAGVAIPPVSPAGKEPRISGYTGLRVLPTATLRGVSVTLSSGSG